MIFWNSIRRCFLLPIAGLVLAPRWTYGCAVCFGDPQAPATQGMNWAILTLLGITLGVLAGVVSFMIYLGKKSAAAAARLEEIEREKSISPAVAALDLRHRRLSRAAHQGRSHEPAADRLASRHSRGQGRNRFNFSE